MRCDMYGELRNRDRTRICDLGRDELLPPTDIKVAASVGGCIDLLLTI